jgi:hypothetical protein
MVMGIQAAEAVAVLASTVAIVIGFFVLFEKISGVTGRWASRQVESGVMPMRDHLETQIDDVSATNLAAHAEIKGQLANMQEYNYYHLGPNHTTTPVHVRLIRLEEQMKTMAATDVERRRFQDFVDRAGQDKRDTKYDDEKLED